MKRLTLLLPVVIAGIFALAFWQARVPEAPDDAGFDPLAFFEGRSVSAGTVTTALLRIERFTAEFAGERTGDTFRLEERFHFPDKNPLQVWTFREEPSGALSASVETENSEGVLETPVPVAVSTDENGVILDYEGIAPGGGMRLHFRHLMHMQPDGTVRNHVVVARFGIPLATSRVTFAKDRAALPSLTRER